MICRYVQGQLGGEAHLSVCWLDENLVLKAPTRFYNNPTFTNVDRLLRKYIQDNALNYDRLLNGQCSLH